MEIIMTTEPNKTTTTPHLGKGTRLRKMKPYHPRRSSRSLRLTRQQLLDLEHKISIDIGTFLVLLEEGNTEQIELAARRARSDFLKYAPDIKKLGVEMGSALSHLVDEFLRTIDTLLHVGQNWIDEGKIKDCYNATSNLEKALNTRSSKETL